MENHILLNQGINIVSGNIPAAVIAKARDILSNLSYSPELDMYSVGVRGLIDTVESNILVDCKNRVFILCVEYGNVSYISTHFMSFKALGAILPIRTFLCAGRGLPVEIELAMDSEQGLIDVVSDELLGTEVFDTLCAMSEALAAVLSNPNDKYSYNSLAKTLKVTA